MCAPNPMAVRAAHSPITPAPRITTVDGGTPEIPPSMTPRPPSDDSSSRAAVWTAIEPAISCIIRTMGNVPSASAMNSNPIPVTRKSISRLSSVGSRPPRWRAENRTWRSRMRSSSSGRGGNTLATRSAWP